MLFRSTHCYSAAPVGKKAQAAFAPTLTISGSAAIDVLAAELRACREDQKRGLDLFEKAINDKDTRQDLGRPSNCKAMVAVAAESFPAIPPAQGHLAIPQWEDRAKRKLKNIP